MQAKQKYFLKCEHGKKKVTVELQKHLFIAVTV